MSDHPKITPISSGRKSPSGPKIEKRAGAGRDAQAAYEKALRKQKGEKGLFGGGGSGNIRWYHYVQFLLFLGLVGLFMRSCSM